jgi:hypothetical protein
MQPAHSDNGHITARTTWGDISISPRDLLIVLPLLALLTLVWFFGREFLLAQRTAFSDHATLSASQGAHLIALTETLIEEQRIATYLASLPPDHRPALPMPRGLSPRLAAPAPGELSGRGRAE